MKDTLFALLGLVFAIAAVFSFYTFQSGGEQANTLFMILGALFALLAVACGVMFMTKKVNKGEDIHITE